MNETHIKIKKWHKVFFLMLMIQAAACGVFKFNLETAAGTALIEGLILLRFGERLERNKVKKDWIYPHFMFAMLTVVMMVIAFYLIGQAAYTTEESYFHWLTHGGQESHHSIDFEIGTLILINYFIFVLCYRDVLKIYIKESINKWLPSLWCIVLGGILVLYLREGFNHAVRISTLFVGGSLLISQLIYQNFISREQKVKFYIKPRTYLVGFITSFIIVGVIGISLPEYQELPGARWFRNVINSLAQDSKLHQRIPYEARLNNDISLSNAVLFEVKSTEPLYLREIAYTEYEDGTWRIPAENEGYDAYIDLKFKYLDAEYEQTSALLNEIAYQNRQEPDILMRYAKMANYESAIIRKKSYVILQNPIDKINYFTVNGFFDIQDPAAKTIYYYQNLNNCYFHSQNILEPSNYEVFYYDRTPRQGSREYIFLKSINNSSWEQIYNKVVENREKYHLYDEEIPKFLYTYTPMIQYKNAKECFMQVPEELQKTLQEFTNKIVLTKQSDWDKAEMICSFLKNNYTYRLQNKKVQEERVTHFLFEEKEGICQDFATSMTLMCRSIGIPAKYVTGYLAHEKNGESDNYIVREKDAHAFVEVYIAGYGWMSFDPTPSREKVEEPVVLQDELNVGEYAKFTAAIIVIAAILFTSRGGITYCEEKWWVLTFKIIKMDKKLPYLIKRELRWLGKSGWVRMKYETLSQYAKRLKRNGIDISKGIEAYEKQKYGEIKLNSQQIYALYEEYKALKLMLKRLK